MGLATDTIIIQMFDCREIAANVSIKNFTWQQLALKKHFWEVNLKRNPDFQAPSYEIRFSHALPKFRSGKLDNRLRSRRRNGEGRAMMKAALRLHHFRSFGFTSNR